MHFFRQEIQNDWKYFKLHYSIAILIVIKSTIKHFFLLIKSRTIYRCGVLQSAFYVRLISGNKETVIMVIY